MYPLPLTVARRRMKLSDQIRTAPRECGTSRYEIWKETGIDQWALFWFVAGKAGMSCESGSAMELNIAIGRSKRR